MIERKKQRIEILDGSDILHGSFRDFAGSNSAFGTRSFSIRLDEDTANEFREGGWPVKTWVPKDKDGNASGDPLQFLSVKIYYKGKDTDPEITIMDEGTKKKRRVTVDNIRQLDNMDFKYAKIEFHPYYQDNRNYQGWVISLDRMFAEYSTEDFDRMMSVDDDDADDWLKEDADTL